MPQASPPRKRKNKTRANAVPNAIGDARQYLTSVTVVAKPLNGRTFPHPSHGHGSHGGGESLVALEKARMTFSRSCRSP
jgi:hypothetical protein